MRSHLPFFAALLCVGVIVPTVADDRAESGTVLSRYRLNATELKQWEAQGVEFQVEKRRNDRHGQTVFDVLIPRREGERAVPTGQLLEANIHDEYLRLPAATRASYHDYPAVKAHLERLEKENSDLLQVQIYGTSKENRDLYAVQMATPLAAGNFRPGLLLTGGTHGDELIGVEVLFNVIEQTIAGVKSGDPVIKKALENFTLYFVPVVNPDGFTRRDRYANGIDPNRDFPWPGNPSKIPNEAIQSLMDLVATNNIFGAIDWHADAGVVGYPWSYQQAQVADAKDRQAYQTVAAAMGRAAGYPSGQIPKVLYIAQGSSGDWYYWQHHTLAFVMEVSQSKQPNPSSWPARFKENFAAYKAFLGGMTDLQTSGRR